MKTSWTLPQPSELRFDILSQLNSLTGYLLKNPDLYIDAHDDFCYTCGRIQYLISMLQ